MTNVINFNPNYRKYNKLWNEDRWNFSCELVKYTISDSNGKLTNEDRAKLDTMNQIVEENDGAWLDGHIYSNGVLVKNSRKYQ